MHDLDHDAELRRLLVATVDAGVVARRSRWKLAVVSVAAFALAGTLAGGALASAALTRSRDGGPRDLEIRTPSFIDERTQILSTPIVVTGRGEALVDLGEAPPGATGVAIAVYCLEYGSFHTTVDGGDEFGLSCTPDDSGGSASGGGGGIFPIEGDRSHHLGVTADSGRYAVWVAWVATEPDPAPSAFVTSALADGVVSREEYVAGFEHFVACVEQVGSEVYYGSLTAEIIGYSLPGEDHAITEPCYVREFQDIDMTWQVAHE